MTRIVSRTEEARGSNPLTSTPNLAGQSAAGPTSAALSSSPEAPGATLGPRPGRSGGRITRGAGAVIELAGDGSQRRPVPVEAHM